MPELPEVETVRRSLAPIVGLRIARVTIAEPRMRQPIAPDCADRLAGRRFECVERRGKYLLLRLDDGQTVLAHLGMTGTLELRDSQAPEQKHDHVIVDLGTGRRLVLNDPRRFGLWQLGYGTDFPEVRHLGPDPLEAMPPAAEWKRRCRGRKKPIKNLLLDQQFLAGIGNIYASEILHRAGVRPSRAAGRLSTAELSRIVDATGEVLRHAVELGGSSISDYHDAEGRSGYFQIEHRVYERTGLPCRTCASPIKKIIQVGRSSFYCPKCQR